MRVVGVKRSVVLTQEQQQCWHDNGYLILPGFFSNAELAPVIHLHEQIWETCPSQVVVDDLQTGRRCYMTSLSEAEKTHRFKVNDLYLDYAEVRHLSLNPRLVDILSMLLPDSPVLCNSLSLDYGTQQALHVDSLYMTPRTEGHLAATWIALEDCDPNAGPLQYVPGSHKIPLYRFSNGGFHEVEGEQPQWRSYIQEKVKQYGLTTESFLPKQGDVFIWHANLLHGGSAIANPVLTRKSLVSHYFTKSDCYRLGIRTFPLGAGYWQARSRLRTAEDRFSSRPGTRRVMHVLRTSLHYFRLWKQDVFNSPE